MDVMSQFGGLLLFLPDDLKEKKRLNGYLYRIDKLVFLCKCKPEDTLYIKGFYVGSIGEFHKIKVEVYVEEIKVTEGNFTYILTNN